MDSEPSLEQQVQEGISIMFRNWQVLKIALENNLVGKNNKKIQKEIQEIQNKVYDNNMIYMSDNDLINKFIIDTQDFIFKYECNQIDIEEFLLDYVEDYFYVIIEDSSEKIIAKIILELFEQLQNSNLDKLNELRQLDKKISQYSIPLVKQKNNIEQDEDISNQLEGMNINQEKKQLVDEDGFMLVTKK